MRPLQHGDRRAAGRGGQHVVAAVPGRAVRVPPPVSRGSSSSSRPAGRCRCPRPSRGARYLPWRAGRRRAAARRPPPATNSAQSSVRSTTTGTPPVRTARSSDLMGARSFFAHYSFVGLYPALERDSVPPPVPTAAADRSAVTIARGWLDHAEGSVLVEFGRTRVLWRPASPRASRGGARAPGWAGSPPSTRCCPAPPTRAATASRSRGGSAAGRTRSAGSSAARCAPRRPGRAGGEQHRHRLRRPAGRRGHPDRGHHRRLRRPRRRRLLARRPQEAGQEGAARAVGRRRQRRRHRRRAAAGPRLRGGRRAPAPT